MTTYFDITANSKYLYASDIALKCMYISSMHVFNSMHVYLIECMYSIQCMYNSSIFNPMQSILLNKCIFNAGTV